MAYQKKQYEQVFAAFQKSNPFEWPKYQSATADDLLLLTLVEEQRLPSQTTVQLAINDLLKKNLLFRTDGKNDDDDIIAAAERAKVRIAQTIKSLQADPLSPAELDEFVSLDRKTLAERYWENDGLNQFAVRYRMAVAQWQFRIPERPSGGVS
jgi:hypothetical protein